MIWQYIAPIITALLTLIPTLLAYRSANKKQQMESQTRLAILETKLDSLSNNVEVISKRVYNLERNKL